MNQLSIHISTDNTSWLNVSNRTYIVALNNNRQQNIMISHENNNLNFSSHPVDNPAASAPSSNTNRLPYHTNPDGPYPNTFHTPRHTYRVTFEWIPLGDALSFLVRRYRCGVVSRVGMLGRWTGRGRWWPLPCVPCRLVWLRSSYYFFRYAHGGRGYFRIPRRIKQSIDFFPAARVDSDLDDPRSASTDFEMLRVPLTGPYGQNVVLCWCLMQQGVDGVGSDSTTTPWRNSFMTTILAAKKLDFFFSWTCGRRTRPSKNFRTPQKRKKRIPV